MTTPDPTTRRLTLALALSRAQEFHCAALDRRVTAFVASPTTAPKTDPRRTIAAWTACEDAREVLNGISAR